MGFSVSVCFISLSLLSPLRPLNPAAMLAPVSATDIFAMRAPAFKASACSTVAPVMENMALVPANFVSALPTLIEPSVLPPYSINWLWVSITGFEPVTVMPPASILLLVRRLLIEPLRSSPAITTVIFATCLSPLTLASMAASTFCTVRLVKSLMLLPLPVLKDFAISCGLF